MRYTECMDKRILWLSDTAPESPKSVVYIMSRDQRVRDNHALLAAQTEALKYSLPLVVVFNLLPHVGVRAYEQYEFMISGLKQVEAMLSKKGIGFIIQIGPMRETLKSLGKSLQPRSVYFDFSPLHGVRAAQKNATRQLDARCAVVDTHNIVPVWVTSDTQEFAAHTIRRKLHRTISEWLVEPDTIVSHPYSFDTLPEIDWESIKITLDDIPKCGIDHGFTSGEDAAQKQLQKFIETGLDSYAAYRNISTRNAQSNLSPYLHYGQLSALRIVLDIMKSSDHSPLLLREPKMPSAAELPTRDDGIDAFIEELVVRRELSDNFCFYSPSYTSLVGIPDWARKTLEKHKNDPREFTYTLGQFEHGKTHDDIWNAAQMQLTKTGKIHGYMRMYWAKKILEWSDSPANALDIAIYLNDHYSIDGGDPNGYVGILWSIAGLHDRPWFERDVYGTIRYMNDSGLKKKFDTAAYVTQWIS